MPATDLHHLAIKCVDVNATVQFYNDVIGSHSVKRPNFDFPGAWLQFGTTMIHLYGGDAAKNSKGGHDSGSAAIDHIALTAYGFDEMQQTLERKKLVWRQFDIPSFNLWQLFVFDPNGVLVELNFNSAKEPTDSKGPGDFLRYEPGKFTFNSIVN
tara:strand:- start:1066 stop:1530 length:465 start_codon:yes stop_codon:yes gene_type:complete